MGCFQVLSYVNLVAIGIIFIKFWDPQPCYVTLVQTQQTHWAPNGFFSFLFLCFFSFSFSNLLLCSNSSSSSLFLYSSINFFLPPLTSLPLKNLLHPKHLASRREPIQLRKLLTEESLDQREAWFVAGGAHSLKTLWFLFLLYFFYLLKKAEAWKLWFFVLWV